MFDILPEETDRFLRATAPEPDEVVAAMEQYGQTHGPPTVGREVGQLLRLLTLLTDAERVFEFGSGYGYSAYWFARELSASGSVVLTEHDEEELDLARDFFERGNVADRAVFEHGDAMDVVERHDGPFDVVLIDHQKHRYLDAFEAVRDKLAPGGVVVADNAMTAGPIQFEKLLSLVEGDDPDDANESTRGIAAYIKRVRSDSAFETSFVPLGEGIAVSYKRQ